MNLETLQISSVIKKPPDERSREDLEEILPYLTKRSELLSNLQKGRTNVCVRIVDWSDPYRIYWSPSRASQSVYFTRNRLVCP